MREKIFLILANLFWAGNYVFGKYVVTEMNPLWITFTRWFLSLAFLIPISYFFERPHYREVFKRFWLPLSCMGLLGVIGYNLLLYGALEYTSPIECFIGKCTESSYDGCFFFSYIEGKNDLGKCCRVCSFPYWSAFHINEGTFRMDLSNNI